MTYSKLTDVYIPVYGKSNPRIFDIAKITVHHMAGNLTVESCANVFKNPDREASSNYGIGSDGRIACYVPEEERAWTSNSWANDHVAITIEVADYDCTNWKPSDKAYASTVALCADICNRYGITPKYTSGTNGTFTEHMMFASTSCPGPWWHAHMPQFIDDVKNAMKGDIVTNDDINKIAIRVWEYIYHQGKPDEDKILQEAGYTGKWSNRYNVLDAAFAEIHEVKEEIAEIKKAIENL